MRGVLFVMVMLMIGGNPLQAETKHCPDTLNFSVRTLNDDQQINLCDAYAGKVVLIVNTASKCAFTGQYDGLEKLYERYKDDGLVVLGFPSNDFGNQEPGSEKQIQEFCRMTYGVKFPMFEKTQVKNPVYASILYRELGQAAEEFPKWNFHKYLVDRKGQVVDSYPSPVSPYSGQILSNVQRLLEQ